MEKRSRISGLILLLLFALNYVGNNFFSHTHTIDGVKIVHSHPYSSDAHNHSRGAIQLISQTTFTFTAILVAPLLIWVFKGTINSITKKFCKEFSVVYSTPRAPPVLN